MKQWKPPRMHYKSILIQSWQYKGKNYRATRDEQGYITIASQESESVWYSVGNVGYDYCFREEDIPALANKLGCPTD